MATLTVDNLPDALHAKLKARAEAHNRSISAETTALIARALDERPIREDELLRRAEQLRQRTPTFLHEDDRRRAVEHGRA